MSCQDDDLSQNVWKYGLVDEPTMLTLSDRKLLLDVHSPTSRERSYSSHQWMQKMAAEYACDQWDVECQRSTTSDEWSSEDLYPLNSMPLGGSAKDLKSDTNLLRTPFNCQSMYCGIIGQY